MRPTEYNINRLSYKLFRIIFILCAIYFLLMGLVLIFSPQVLIKGISDAETNPVIIGMLRGAGGSIIPYALLYILVCMDPFKRQWALMVLLLANFTAIVLDLASVMLGEYKFSYALFDIPVEVLSITGIGIIYLIRKKM